MATKLEIKLPKKVHGISKIGFVMIAGRPRVDYATAIIVEDAVSAIRGQPFYHEKFPKTWRVPAIMKMRPETLAKRIMASEQCDKLNRKLGGI